MARGRAVKRRRTGGFMGGMASGAMALGRYALKNRKSITRTARRIGRAFKRGGSKTRTKGKLRHARVQQDGTGTSRSLNYITHPAKNLGKLVKGMKEIQQQDSLTSFLMDTTNAGQQYVTDAGALFGASIIQGFIGTASVNIKAASGVAAPFPYYQSNQKSFKIYLQEVSQYLTFTNVDTGNVTLDIYDCIARHDRASTINPETDWTNGVLYDQSGANSTGTPNTYPWQQPFASKLFNQFWKVKKVTHVDLAQGRSHEHILKFKANRIMDTERTSSSAILGGLTMYTMIVLRGMPGCISGGSTVTLAQAQVAVAGRISYKFRYIDLVPSIYVGAGGFTAGNTKVVSEGAGTVGTIAFASG